MVITTYLYVNIGSNPVIPTINNNINLNIGDITMKRNREKINENGKINDYITVLQGYLNGEEIECRIKGNGTDWYSISSPTFDFDTMEYRIKPIPTYRPYISGEEVFTAMREQSPSGWLYNTLTMCYEQVICIGDNGISTCKESYSFDEAFGIFIYPNDEKFGIKLDNNSNEKD